MFCRIRDRKASAIHVFEDSRILAIMESHPLNDGHVIVLTKHHVRTIYDLSPVDCGSVMLVAKLIAIAVRKTLHPQGVTIVQANGPGAFQSVHHFHLHVIPRWLNDGKGLHWSAALGNMKHIAQVAQDIRRALQIVCRKLGASMG